MSDNNEIQAALTLAEIHNLAVHNVNQAAQKGIWSPARSTSELATGLGLNVAMLDPSATPEIVDTAPRRTNVPWFMVAEESGILTAARSELLERYKDAAERKEIIEVLAALAVGAVLESKPHFAMNIYGIGTRIDSPAHQVSQESRFMQITRSWGLFFYIFPSSLAGDISINTPKPHELPAWRLKLLARIGRRLISQ